MTESTSRTLPPLGGPRYLEGPIGIGSSPWPPPPPQFAPALAPMKNGLATASLVLGLCSILLPFVSILGVIFGVKSLRRIKRTTGLRGRGRSIAGIVTSLVLGPLTAAVFVVGGMNAHAYLDMSKVQSAVQSVVQAQVDQSTGTTVNLQVVCPNQEPRQQGMVFFCNLVVAGSSESFSTQVRETDSNGDLLVGAVTTRSSDTSLTIPGLTDYSTFTGPLGRPLEVGRPWGTVCQPVVFTVSTQMPESVYVQMRAVVTEARNEGVDVTMTNEQNIWDPNDIYPAGAPNADVKFVPVRVSSKTPPTLTAGHLEHIGFGWDAVPASDGAHEVLTGLQATLYLQLLNGHPSDLLRSVRQLVAFSQGVGSSTAPGSGISSGSTVDGFSVGDVSAMQAMSGCTLRPV
jgi:hypothetical protein